MIEEAIIAANRGIAALPEDILVDVFSRVRDVKDLFRCAATCRPWLRLLTDPDFLRQLWPQQDLLLGFFLNCGPTRKRGASRQHKHASSSPLTFLPSPMSPIGSVDGVRFSLAPDDDSIIACYSVQHLASRCGILLVGFVPCQFVAFGRRARFLFGICDPITGAHDVLPHLECAGHGRFEDGHAILTAADVDIGRGEPSSFSQLLVINRHDDDCRWHMHTYSAATRSWRAAAMFLQAEQVWLTGERAAVVHRGVAHWLCIGEAAAETTRRDKGDLCLLSVEAGNGRVYLTKLPMRSPGPSFLFVSRDERLSVACVQSFSVDVWTRQGEGDGAAWLRAQVIQMPASMTWLRHNIRAMLATFSADDKNVFALDLKTGAMEKVMLDQSGQCPLRNEYNRCVPYKRNLSDFFVRQLGGI